MAFIFKPSLQHRAIVKIVTTLWIQDDIRYMIEDLFSNDSSNNPLNEWSDAENKVIEKVKLLSLSKYLESEVLDTVNPIGIEIIRWKMYHDTFITETATECTFSKNLHKLCWTSQGTVDRKKTAEVWIRDEDLDIIKRYELACMYCLENDIRKLWNQLLDTDKEFFYHEYGASAKKSKLVVHWTFYLNEELWEDERQFEKSLNRYAFQQAVNEGNKVATEYFFVKLTPEEKKQYLEKMTTQSLEPWSETDNMGLHREDLAETMCFLLSQMDEKNLQKQMFNCSYEMLRSLLLWPSQIFFLETAQRMWDFLDISDYCKLLFVDIYNNIVLYRSCNYREILNKFWQQSPLNYKRAVFSEPHYYSILTWLLHLSDNDDYKQLILKNAIAFILKDATTEEKLNLLEPVYGLSVCNYLIETKKWGSLEFCIRECISSKEILASLKEILTDDSNLKEILEDYDDSLAPEDFNAVKKELDRVFKLVEERI